jgi:hypothetical protein
MAYEEHYRERARRAGATLGLVLLLTGASMCLCFAVVCFALSSSEWGGVAERARTIVYPAGLLVIPGSFTLMIAGATLVLRRKA